MKKGNLQYLLNSVTKFKSFGLICLFTYLFYLLEQLHSFLKRFRLIQLTQPTYLEQKYYSEKIVFFIRKKTFALRKKTFFGRARASEGPLGPRPFGLLKFGQLRFGWLRFGQLRFGQLRYSAIDGKPCFSAKNASAIWDSAIRGTTDKI